jgi:hypothetical protein
MSFQKSHEYKISTMKESNESFDPLAEMHNFTLIKHKIVINSSKKLNTRDLKYKKCLR